jgi:Spy/CpxP family protein refolding chaperone
MMKIEQGFLASRRTLLLATILAAGSCGLWAQAAPPEGAPPQDQMRQRGPNPEREIAQLTEALALTPDQQTQVKALLKERREKVEALRSGGERPSREQMEGVRKDTDAKINALLNDDQKTKYAAWEKERMEHRRGPGGDGPPPPPSGA